MGVQRATTLYPVNTTTVDSGSGIDVRLLASTEPGADDTSQTVTFTNANDNVERTFDPATAGATNTNDANTTLFKSGWALRLSEDMTPTDDTNCDVMLTGGTITVSLRISMSFNQGTFVSSVHTLTYKASLWKYNPSTDTGTIIASGTTTATTWTLPGDNGVTKTASINITVPATTFSANNPAAEVLYLQVGLNTGTVPNPTVGGPSTFTHTLIVDNTNTKLTFGSGVALIQYCSLAKSLSGIGTATKSAMPVTLAEKNVGGSGAVMHSRLSTIARSYTLNGVATLTHTRPVTANRSFSLESSAKVLTSGTNASTVAIPIDEVPEAGSGPTYIFPVLE